MSTATNHQLYCEQKAIPPGSIEYYRVRFAKNIWHHPTCYSAVIAIMAYCREITTIARECREPAIAQQKFVWWQTELQKLRSHQPAHPVTQALLPLITQDETLMEWLTQFFSIHQQRLAPIHFLTLDELFHHCHETQGLQEMMLAKVIQSGDEASLKVCQAFGVTLELIRLISEFRQDIARDCLLLPEELLEKYRIETKVLYQFQNSAALTALLAEIAAVARRHFVDTRAILNPVQTKTLQSAHIASALYCELLRAIQEDGFQVFSHQILLPPLRLCWKAWRISRQ